MKMHAQNYIHLRMKLLIKNEKNRSVSYLGGILSLSSLLIGIPKYFMNSIEKYIDNC